MDEYEIEYADIHPIERYMDPVLIRVLRDGEWKRVCFTDLTDGERSKVLDSKDARWLRRMCEILADLINDPFKKIEDAEEMSDHEPEPEVTIHGVPEDEKQKNRELCRKYPFLQPRDWRDDPYPDEDYSFTYLDDMPVGWKKAFGEQMCEEIMQVLSEDGNVDNYRVLQVKEKYGTLHWYDNGVSDKVYEILNKYEDLSERTCCNCGKPATAYSTGWISPWCDECAAKIGGSFIPAEKYFGGRES